MLSSSLKMMYVLLAFFLMRAVMYVMFWGAHQYNSTKHNYSISVTRPLGDVFLKKPNQGNKISFV